MNLFKFELVKLRRNKKTWVLLIIVFLSLIFASFQLNKQQKELAHAQFEESQQLYNLVHHQRYEAYYEEDGSITKDNHQLIDKLTTIKQTIKAYDEQRLAGDWQAELKSRILFEEQAIDFLQVGGNLGDLTLKELHLKKLEHQLLSKKKIPPTMIQAGQGGWYFVKFIADYWFRFFGILLLLLMCYDAFTSEKETRSLNFLFVQPFSKGAIFRSKVLSNFLIMMGLLTLVLAIFFMVGTIRYGTGSLSYPIVLNLNLQPRIITLGTYLVNGLILHAILSLYTLIYLFILSTWRQHSFEVLGFALVSLLFPAVLLNNSRSLNSIASWFPFNYLDLTSLLTNGQDLLFTYAVLIAWLVIGIISLRFSIRRNFHEFN